MKEKRDWFMICVKLGLIAWVVFMMILVGIIILRGGLI